VVGLGTDGAASNNNLDLLEEVRLAALLHKGFSGDPTVINAHQALRLATSGGAGALGLGERVGRWKWGRGRTAARGPAGSAQSAALRRRIADGVRGAQFGCGYVVVDGEVLVRHGLLTRLDEREVIARAAECARRLTGGRMAGDTTA